MLLSCSPLTSLNLSEYFAVIFLQLCDTNHNQSELSLILFRLMSPYSGDQASTICEANDNQT